jgi:hypothetical protein
MEERIINKGRVVEHIDIDGTVSVYPVFVALFDNNLICAVYKRDEHLYYQDNNRRVYRTVKAVTTLSNWTKWEDVCNAILPVT